MFSWPTPSLQSSQSRCREDDGDLQDALDQLAVVRALERWTANHHLIEQDAHAPDVQRVVVAFALDHLGRQVIHRAAERGAQDVRGRAPRERSS